jgi:hypothetical protein
LDGICQFFELLGGDKAGNWQRWYRQNIPIAEQLYLEYATEHEE